MFKSLRPPRPPRPSKPPKAPRDTSSGFFNSQPRLLLSLLLLIAVVTAVGAWNQQRLAQQPQASFSLSDTDLMPDDLSPDINASLTPGASLTMPASGPTTESAPASSSADSAAPAASASPDARIQIGGRNVNLRAQPSRKAAIVATSQLGTTYKLTGKHSKAEDLDWVEIQLPDGKIAWVSAAFVAPLNSADIGTTRDPVSRETPAAASTAAPTTPSTPARPMTEDEEIEAAAALVAKLLTAPGQIWPQADPALRQLTSRTLLKKIFRDKPEANSEKHAKALDECMAASSKAPDLKNLKVYELSAACALALNWR